MTIGFLYLQTSIWRGGLSLKGMRCEKKAIIRGTTIYHKADFQGAKFENGLFLTSARKVNAPFGVIDSVVENANFQGVKFLTKNKEDQEEPTTALNFTNTKFLNKFDFGDVEIDGLPWFTDTVLPPNAVFRNLRPNKHFEDAKDTNTLSKYITAFRLIRQILEKQYNMTEVHKFGRLEAIAKNRRGVTPDVSLAEVFFSKAYGLFGDFGQSIKRPLIGLGGTAIFSGILQTLILWLSNQPCYWPSKSCLVDWSIGREAVDRATVYAAPPFSMLAKRNAPSPTKNTEKVIDNSQELITCLLYTSDAADE